MDNTGAQMKRRGLVAGAAALLGAALSKASEQVARAQSTGMPFILGTLNVANRTTELQSGNANSADEIGLLVHDGPGRSVFSVAIEGVSDFGIGVFGVGNSPNDPQSVGVKGEAATGYGVYGVGIRSDGVAGLGGRAGCAGFSSDGYGIYGGVTNGGSGFAAGFQGPVLVNGSFTVVGGPKSAGVPHPDGTYRRLYCVESPESVFEDFGRGQLLNGAAHVALDPAFAAVVDSQDYYVYLTPRGDSNGLYVSAQQADGFQVREQRGGRSHLAFDYRVVARRADIAAPRLELMPRPDLSHPAPAP